MLLGPEIMQNMAVKSQTWMRNFANFYVINLCLFSAIICKMESLNQICTATLCLLTLSVQIQSDLISPCCCFVEVFLTRTHIFPEILPSIHIDCVWACTWPVIIICYTSETFFQCFHLSSVIVYGLYLTIASAFCPNTCLPDFLPLASFAASLGRKY